MSSALTRALTGALKSRAERDILRSLPSAVSPSTTDLTSNDYLGLTTSPILRARLLEKIDRKEDRNHVLGSGGSRLLVNPVEHSHFESRLQMFFNADAALVFNSGFDANASFFACLPQRGDLVVYDEYIHASVHDGLKLSRLLPDDKLSFPHNSLQGLRSVLVRCLQDRESLRVGQSSLFLSVESLYSMDGTFAPLPEMVQLLEELFPYKNAYFVVDEAHATGIYGPKGRGRVAMFNLEGKVFARLHTFGKALGATGAVYLISPLVRTYLINYARPFIFTTALSTLNIILADSVFDLLEDGTLDKYSSHLQHLVEYLLERLISRLDDLPPSLLRIPRMKEPSQILPLFTSHAKSLSSYLLDEYGINARPIVWPTVPKGTERVRVCLNSTLRKRDVDRLVDGVVAWTARFNNDGAVKAHL